jgi:hypothetical protein
MLKQRTFVPNLDDLVPASGLGSRSVVREPSTCATVLVCGLGMIAYGRLRWRARS